MTIIRNFANTAAYIAANGQYPAANLSGQITPSTIAYAGGVVYENSNTISSNYTMTAGRSGMSAGPITISTGVTVTLPSGSRWVIL